MVKEPELGPRNTNRMDEIELFDFSDGINLLYNLFPYRD
jgi:hypothetical protein